MQRFETRPKVSVLTITYNHENFIAQAIDSALMQRTDFEYEIVIGEDCSTDRTREIVKAHAERHPDKIRALFHPHNLGPHQLGLAGRNNLIATYKACRGQYVAWLDGDDYWTDPHKLQKQVAFLDTHPECTICCHPVQIIYSDSRAKFWPSVTGTSSKEICTLEDLMAPVNRSHISMPSMMIRNGVITEFPDWFHEVFNGDSAIHFLLAHHGHVGFLKECMAVHRKHGAGPSRLFETHPEYCNDMYLKLLLHVDRHFDYRHHEIFKHEIAGRWRHKAFLHKANGEYRMAIAAFVRYLVTDSTDLNSLIKRVDSVLRFLLPQPLKRILKLLASRA